MYICQVHRVFWGIVTGGALQAQVAIVGGWGGHTSYNDLVASGERWHRFYGAGHLGVRLLPEKRLQPGLYWEGGRFISQDRQQRAFTRTAWNAIGLSLRGRLLKAPLSPFLEGTIFRLSATPRTAGGQVPPGSPSAIGAVGIGWGGGICWQPLQWVEFSLQYFRKRPQTSYLEGVRGTTRDRIEGFLGQLSVILGGQSANRSRFQ